MANSHFQIKERPETAIKNVSVKNLPLFTLYCYHRVKNKNEVASRPTAGRLGDVLSDRQE